MADVLPFHVSACDQPKPATRGAFRCGVRIRSSIGSPKPRPRPMAATALPGHAPGASASPGGPLRIKIRIRSAIGSPKPRPRPNSALPTAAPRCFVLTHTRDAAAGPRRLPAASARRQASVLPGFSSLITPEIAQAPHPASGVAPPAPAQPPLQPSAVSLQPIFLPHQSSAFNLTFPATPP